MSNKHGNQGTRYAVLIGINYTNHSKRQRLNGCHNDVLSVRKYIMDVGRIKASNITVLMDDGKSALPTKDNIMDALDDLCKKVRGVAVTLPAIKCC